MRAFRPLVLATLVAALLLAPAGHGLAAPSATNQTHCVKRGETLTRIALLYGTSVQAIAAANGIVNPNLIREGQCLTIPAAGSPAPSPQPGYPATGPCSAPNSPLLKSSSFIFTTATNAGAWLKPGFKAAGCANVFEAQFSWRLKGSGGGQIADGQVHASCGTGCVGSFSFSVPYSVSQTQIGTLEVFDNSANDGSEILLNAIQVVLQP
jgi:hypothetical protein